METIACRLTAPDLQARRETVLRVLGKAVEETDELPDGWAFRFAGHAEHLRELAELIVFERRCCPFLRFVLSAEPNDGPIWLHVSGPEETKPFVATLFK